MFATLLIFYTRSTASSSSFILKIKMSQFRYHTIFSYRLIESVGFDVENHPYLGNMDLEQHMNAGNLYFVNLPNIGITVSNKKESTENERYS